MTPDLCACDDWKKISDYNERSGCGDGDWLKDDSVLDVFLVVCAVYIQG